MLRSLSSSKNTTNTNVVLEREMSRDSSKKQNGMQAGLPQKKEKTGLTVFGIRSSIHLKCRKTRGLEEKSRKLSVQNATKRNRLEVTKVGTIGKKHETSTQRAYYLCKTQQKATFLRVQKRALWHILKPENMLLFRRKSLRGKGLEKAPPGFEPGNRGFAIRCLSRLATAPEYSMKSTDQSHDRFGIQTRLRGRTIKS